MRTNVKKSLLSTQWENEHYIAYFTHRPTHNPNEYLWFSLDWKTGEHEQWIYRIDRNEVIIDFKEFQYMPKEIDGMKIYGILMMQWIDIAEPRSYINWRA